MSEQSWGDEIAYIPKKRFQRVWRTCPARKRQKLSDSPVQVRGMTTRCQSAPVRGYLARICNGFSVFNDLGFSLERRDT